MTAILAGHAAVAGASAGPAAGAGIAAAWATLLPTARLPHAAAVALAQSLCGRSIPDGARAALLPALVSMLAPAAVRSHADNEAATLAMCDLCDVVDPDGHCGLLSAVPVWRTTAEVALHAWLDGARGDNVGFGCSREGAAYAAASAPTAWTQLRVLSLAFGAGPSAADAMALAQLAADVADTSASAAARLSRPDVDKEEGPPLVEVGDSSAHRLVALQGAAQGACLRILAAHAPPAALGGCASAALRHCSERPVAGCLLHAAADALDAWTQVSEHDVGTGGGSVPAPGWDHPPEKGQSELRTTWLPVLAPALISPCRSVRHGALRVLAHFQVPELLSSAPSSAPAPPASPPFFAEWCALAAPLEDGAALTLGRTAALTLASHARLLRARRVAPDLISSLARCALGGLRTRFAPLWPHCQDVLAACLEAGDAPAVFPLIVSLLRVAQAEILTAASHNGGVQQQHGDTPERHDGADAYSPGGTLLLPPDAAEAAFRSALLDDCERLDVPDSTEGHTLLRNLLAALSRASAVLSNRGLGAQLAPLFMAYAEAASSIGGKRHAAGLKDWLSLVTALGGARALGPAALSARTMIQDSLLAHSDVAVQQAALACLRTAGKELQSAPHLRAHGDHLARLIAPKTMRSEMAHWSVAPGAQNGIQQEHRAAVIPLLLAVLYPKLRTRRGRDSRGAPGATRAAVLAYLAGLSSIELVPLFRRLLSHLQLGMPASGSGAWDGALGQRDPGLITRVDADALRSVPLRRRLGFLHTVGDVLTHLGEHAIAFWDPLVGMTTALLDSTLPFLVHDVVPAAAAATVVAAPMDGNNLEEDEPDDGGVPTAKRVDEAQDDAAVEPPVGSDDEEDEMEEGVTVSNNQAVTLGQQTHEARQLRGHTIRVLASAMRRHPVPELWSPYWPALAAAAAALSPRLVLDAASSASGPPPPMLDLACAVASHPELAHHVGDDACITPSVIAVLASQKASPASRTAACSVLSGVLDATHDVGLALLRPHALALLAALRDVLMQGGPTSKGVVTHCLTLLVRLAPVLMSQHGADVDAAAGALVDALLPALGATSKKGCSAAAAWGRGHLSEPMAIRVLAAVNALFAADAALEALRVRAGDVASALGPLFGATLRSPESRTALVDAFDAIARHVPHCADVVPVLRELNAPGTERLEGIDIGRQLAAYNGLTEAAFTALLVQPRGHAAALDDARTCGLAPLLHQCLCDIKSPDMALRHAAAGTLEVFLRAAAKTDASLASVVQAQEQGQQSSRGKILITTIVLPCVRAGMRGGTSQGRQQHVALLCAVVKHCPGAVPPLAKLHTAGGDGTNAAVDPEASVWFNLTHVQQHRRTRALRRLGAACAALAASPTANGDQGGVHTVNGDDASAVAAYVAPLCEAALADAIPESGTPSPELGDAAVEALAGCAASLSWNDASGLLKRRLQAASARPSHAKLETRAAAAIIGALRFGGEASTPPAVIAYLQRSVLPALSDLVVVADGETDAGSVRPAAVLAAVKALKLLPPSAASAAAPSVLGAPAGCLRSRATGVRSDARQALCAAAAELGPGALPFIISIVATNLRQGFQTHVLGFTLHALLRACSDAHQSAAPEAFAGAADALATHIEEDIFGDPADEKDAAPGLVAQWKEAKSGCRSFDTLELLAQRAPFPAKAEVLISIVTHHLAHATPGAGTSAAKTRTRCERALHSLSRGWARHGSASPAALMAFVHATLDDGVRAQKAACEWKHTGNGHATAPPPGVALGEHVPPTGSKAHAHAVVAQHDSDGDEDEEIMDVDDAEGDDDDDDADGDDAPQDEEGSTPAIPPNFELLTAFAASLLYMHLKSGGGISNNAAISAERREANADADAGDAFNAVDDPEDIDEAREPVVGSGGDAAAQVAGPRAVRRSLLDGMVPVLVKTVRSRHGPTCQGALRCLSALVSLRLPQLTAAAPALAKRLHALLRRTSGRVSDPTAGAALRLWGSLLRFIPELQPTSAQSTLLLRAAASDLDAPDSSGASFNLLRALLARQPLPAETHSLMESVRQLMIRAHGAAVRAAAQRALVQYLLAAPLGPRRFGQHLEFLVSNLGYAHPDGRMAAVSCLSSLLPRLPGDVLDGQAQYVLLPLVARLVGDPVSEVRAAAGLAITTLLTHLSPAAADSCIDVSHAWLTGDDGRLRRAAAQLLGLAVEAQAGAVARAWRARLAPGLASLMDISLHADSEATANAIRGETEGDGAEMEEELGVVAPHWQAAYYACTLLEKAWRCDQLRGHLSTQAADTQLWTPAALQMLGHRHAWVRSVSSRLLGAYCSRCSPDGVLPLSATPAGGILAGEGLAAAARGSASVLASGGLDNTQQSQVVRNLVFLAAAAMTRACIHDAAADSGDNDAGGAEAQSDGDGEGEPSTHAVSRDARFATWLLRRIIAIGAPGATEDDRCAVLRWSAGVAARCATLLAEAASEEESEDVRMGLITLLVSPAYRATEGAGSSDAAQQAVPPAVRSLGEEVMAHLSNVLPHAALTAAVTRLRAGALAKRSKRRSERALEAVMDAGAAQRRRVNRAAKKKASASARKEMYAAHKAKGTVAPEVMARRMAKQAKKPRQTREDDMF